MNRTSVDVRHAGAPDIGLLLALSEAALVESGHDVQVGAATRRVRVLAALERPDVEVLLAQVAQEPVGVLVLRRDEVLPLAGADAVHVEQLWVHPGWRHRGVAKALLRVAAGRGEAMGVDQVICSAPSGDRDAARFLARLGFTPLVTHRVSPVGALLRRLTPQDPQERSRLALEQTLARRRREHARRPGGADRPRQLDPLG